MNFTIVFFLIFVANFYAFSQLSEVYMADIIFYNTKSDVKKLVKKLDKIFETTCRWKEDTSIYNPIIQVRTSDDFSSKLRDINYCKWGSWYYFVTDVKLCVGGIISFTLTIDVLMTWADEIKKIQTVIDRSESSWNKFIDDSEFMGMSVQRNISKKVIGSVGDSQSYVLTVNGGV